MRRFSSWFAARCKPPAVRCFVACLLLAACCLLVVGSADAAGPGATDLTWTDNATNELGFEVERKPGLCAATGTWAKVGEVGANVKLYTDATTAAGNTYAFRVRAYNNTLADGSGVKQFSGYSNCAEATYPLAVPAAPSGLTAQ